MAFIRAVVLVVLDTDPTALQCIDIEPLCFTILPGRQRRCVLKTS